MRDEKISGPRLQKLHPRARDIFRAFIEECEAKDQTTTLRIVQGYRTFGEQKALYEQGRTAPGNIVTNSKPGQSYHNYGLATDLVELDGEHNETADWNFDMGQLKGIATKYGIKWGGDFRSITDKPHFELTFGYTWQQLLEKYNNKETDKNGYVNI